MQAESAHGCFVNKRMRSNKIDFLPIENELREIIRLKDKEIKI